VGRECLNKTGGLTLDTRHANVEMCRIAGDATIVTSITLSTKPVSVGTLRTIGDAIIAIGYR
jgi:hypothetical protein